MNSKKEINKIDVLEQIFSERDSVFEHKTTEIFKLISVCCIAITKFLKDIDTISNQGEFEWEDINIMDDLVIIIGVILYDIGSTIIVDNKKIVITEENLDYFQKVIQMSLPLDIVLLELVDEILEYLYTMYESEKLDTVAEPLGIKENLDFDLSQLTDKQKQSLMQLNIKQLKIKNN